MTENAWRWERPNPNGVQVGGNLDALFRAKAPKAPGHLSINEPTDSSTLLAREAIQNSWDAALELDEKSPRMSLSFEFVALKGAKKKQVIKLLGLDDLKNRADVKKWESFKFPDPKKAFNFLEKNQPLRILKVIETGTTGMYGPWTWEPGFEENPGEVTDNPSKMMLALLSLGIPVHMEGVTRGGAFGHGKAGLLSASGTKTVIAYSCFKENLTEPGVTRRLYGVNYWGPHQVGPKHFIGFGHFGDQISENITLPFENEAADQVAETLGISKRNGNDPSNWGTSFLLVEPILEAKDLNAAIERSWWPAQEEHKKGFQIQTIDYDGTKINMDPLGNQPELAPYIRAYAIVKKAEKAELADGIERFRRPPDDTFRRIGRPYSPGKLALVADPDGWSFPEPDETEPRSLVVLIRKPRMVTQYFDAGPGLQRQVRGTFLADDAYDAMLGETEPPMHDDWNERNPEKGLAGEPKDLAKKIKTYVKGQVSSFRNTLAPPRPPRDAYDLPEVRDLMKDLFVIGDGPPPPPPKRPPLIHVEPAVIERSLHSAPPSEVYIGGGCQFSLNDEEIQKPKNSALLVNGALPIQITVKCGFAEDGAPSKGGRWAVTNVISSLPAGFKVISSNQFELVITGSLRDPITIEVESEPYDQDYTASFDYKVGPQSSDEGKGQ